MELFSGERVVNGSVKRAYPLQSLRSASGDGPAASPGGGELGTFGPGVGPCGPDASQLYKVQVKGRGLVALEWEAGAETEERVQCIVVAERNVLKKTLDRQPRLFTFPHSLHIEIAYEEPQRLPESDQLRYLPSKTVTTRDLHSAAPTRQTLIQVQAPPKKKPNHGKRTLELAKIMSPAYRYSPLSELVDGYADIYGVIINVTLPKKTSGRDFCMTVSVTDESCPTRAAAIQINIFYPSIAKMPKIKYVGDIIRFHKVKIQQYQDRIQGLSLHRATRHLVLREANGALEQVTNSDTWTFEPSDEQRTRKLLTWARKSLAEDDTLPQGCALAPKLLSELKFAEGFIDLVVRVLNLDDSDEPVRLTVWDGSGNAADSDRSLVRALQDKGAAVPPYGLLKEVIMSSCWPVVREMGFVEGMLTNWCRFRNLAVGVDEPIPGAAVAPGGREILRFREVTSFVLMPDFALDVKRRCSLTNRPNSSTTANDDHIRAAEENLVSPVEVATVIPDRIQKKIPVTPLCEILSSSQTPRKFHCCARVSSIWPTDIEKICKPKPGSDCEFIYSFALTVEEGSNSMNIIVYGKDAEHFLHGIPPCDLSKSTSSKTLLKKRFAALLKSPNAFHWCIKSYSVSLPLGRSADPGTAVRHRLFDTLLQCS
ncbi:hypothetical protein PC129_g22035 [Phytophthora cactorum]|uniref:Telomeric single stranded DNA binding POT1/Cdc13 domain-containing protein n=1 Tax=Phytophthora cactorum TaxID=29920 RepID=A0A8T1H4C5_9STRA|nr:hypothetical protein PC129_g22035 [Phytophthora cactorum]